MASLDDAEAAIELADAYGMGLDESQRITLMVGCATRADGRWASSTMADAEPRQSGKGDTIQARELYGLTALGEQILHTAHEVPTVNKAFLRMAQFIEANQDLRRLVDGIFYGNGNQSIVMTSGASIAYKTRTGGAGRGFDDVDLIVYDEAQHLHAEHLAASSATSAVAENPQAWLAGTAGLAFSEPWWAQRIQALRDVGAQVPELFRALLGHVSSVGGRFGYVEHTAERVSLDDDGRVVSVSPDVEDRRSWALANPAYEAARAVRIDDEFLERQLGLMGPDLFAREHLGVWDPLPDTAGVGREISAAVWARRADTTSTVGDRLVVGVDAAEDAASAAIGVAGDRLGGGGHVEVVEAGPGVDWVAERLAGVLVRVRPQAVAIHADSPVQQIRPALERVCAAADVPFRQVSTRSFAAACGEFVDAVKGRRLVHLDQSWLNMAVAAGRRRVFGSSWTWDRRVPGDISPLVAVTVARRISAELDEVDDLEPVFAYS